jgi:hypothetical protein
MDARRGGIPYRVPSGIYIRFTAAAEGGYRTVLHRVRHSRDGGFIARGRRGKPRLDDIHPQSFEGAGNLKLLPRVHRTAGRLLPVAQCRIQDFDGSGQCPSPPPFIKGINSFIEKRL